MEKTDSIPSKKGQIDEKLMKPFSLGWTREVVKRVITKNPTCDIYYLSPTGRKIRSLNEIKAQLTDGLTPDCFSFKREILGIDIKFETVRDANSKRKDKMSQRGPRSERKNKREEPEPGPSGEQLKKRKIEVEKTDLGSEKMETTEGAKDSIEKKQESKVNSVKEEKEEDKIKNNNHKDTAQEPLSKSSINKKRLTRNTLTKVPPSKMEKKGSKRVMCKQRRRSRLLGRQKILGKAVTKAVTQNNELTESTNKKETEVNNKNEALGKRNEKLLPKTSAKTDSQTKNHKTVLTRREKSVSNTSTGTETKSKKHEANLKVNDPAVQNSKADIEKEVGKAERNEEEEDPGSSDLKTIVQKNIGKYRELREKQKLTSVRGEKKPIRPAVVNNSRAESFLKNKHNYLKPLQKGWRRELVYRSNCSKAGLQADVYYFHPSGKKFRSSREILEHSKLIGGLPIEFFSFRKEAIGCGEPQEIIRNARRPQKN